MGLASSMGLGIALARPDRQVVVFDGDGSILMNLGGLTTLARYRPTNLVHVVFDNESLLSVGGFPTATSTGSDLAQHRRGRRRAAHVHRARRSTTSRRYSRDAHARPNELTTHRGESAKRSGPSGYVTDLALLENRFEFQTMATTTLTAPRRRSRRRPADDRRSHATARPEPRRSSGCRRSSRRRPA